MRLNITIYFYESYPLILGLETNIKIAVSNSLYQDASFLLSFRLSTRLRATVLGNVQLQTLGLATIYYSSQDLYISNQVLSDVVLSVESIDHGLEVGTREMKQNPVSNYVIRKPRNLLSKLPFLFLKFFFFFLIYFLSP